MGLLVFWLAARPARAKTTAPKVTPEPDEPEPVEPHGTEPADVELPPEIELPAPSVAEPEPATATDQLQPVDVAALEASTPTPGRMYQVRRGDILLGDSSRSIVGRALRAAAAEVAARQGIDAKAFADEIAGSASRRRAYADLILCSGSNDMVYGTYGYGDQAYVGPHGRSIRMLKYHADNRSRAREGRPLLRNIAMLTPGKRQAGDRAKPLDRTRAVAFEWLWLPPLDLDRLYREKIVTSEGLRWNDGTPQLWAPPQIQALEVEAFDDPDLGYRFGCGEGEMVSP